jgi:hypothetical protein
MIGRSAADAGGSSPSRPKSSPSLELVALAPTQEPGVFKRTASVSAR